MNDMRKITKLIPINKDTKFPINLRNVWKFIESKRQFTDWIKIRIEKYEFINGIDFHRFHKLMKGDKSGYGNKTMIEYHSTIDMAKELAMIENNDKGRQVRRYFIDTEKKLLEITDQAKRDFIDWRSARLDGKIARKELTDTIQKFVDYAIYRGSTGAKMYFVNFSMLTNRSLFYCPTLKKLSKNMRECISREQLIKLSAMEMIISNVIVTEIEKGTEYKDIYRYIKDKVEEFSTLIGKSLPVGLNKEEINTVIEKKYIKQLTEKTKRIEYVKY